MPALVDRSATVHSIPTDADVGEHRSVAVVGAGITGLVAAYELRRLGIDVTLYEASPHAGGNIRTTHDDGFLAEHGPNSFVTSAPVEALLAKLDLLDDVVEANPSANKRYVVRGGQLVPFPLSPSTMLRTKLFSFRAKLRVLLEPLVARGASVDDESVASFVRRRLGREVLEFAVDPFISGIFAGDPETLSMAHAFPRVHNLERTYGSISKGLMAQRRDAKRARASLGTNASTMGSVASTSSARLISFVDGMQTLPDALEASLTGTLRLGCPARLLHRDNERWVLEAGPDLDTHKQTVDAVVLATPAHALAAMELPAELRRLASGVERVEYPPVSALTLGFRRCDVAHPLDGFGMLIPAVEQRNILGVLFTSSLFPARAPDAHVTITCFVGGARHPALAREHTAALVQRVLPDLQTLIGVRGEPVYVKHMFWPRAIPQYTVGYAAVKSAADAMEVENPGLFLAGNYRNGVSVGDCVAGGQQIAERVAVYLARAG